LVFTNGHFAPALSSTARLPKNVKAMSLADAIKTERATVEKHLARYADPAEHAFVALNTAYVNDGAFVHIPRGAVVEQPIHLLFVSTAGDQPTVSHPRNLIVIEEAAQATIVESYASISPDLYFTNAVTEIVAGDSSVVDHYKIQEESEAAYHVARNQVTMGRACNFSTQMVNFGGRLARNEVHATLGGEGIECIVNGLTMIGGQQHVDNHMRIDHAQPHCASHELFKGVLDARASSVFSGRIIVRPGAQKTDAKQSSMNLLLSDDAIANTQPQLEIFADDVKCTHGATIGQLDRDAIFYLQTRGISEREARGLLTYAFANDVIERIKVAPVRERLERAVLDRFRTMQKAGEAS
jgi:Fe-S cluster assembly protein SufD